MHDSAFDKLPRLRGGKTQSVGGRERMRAGEIAKAQNEERKGGDAVLRDFFAKQKKGSILFP